MKALNGIVVALMVCALASFGVFGCNTFRGAGRDIQKGGRAVEKAADDVQYAEGRYHTITASAEAGGSIRPSGNVNAPYGSSRTFIVKPSRGYHVTDVIIDGKSVGAVDRYTFNDVTASHTISVLFARHQSH